MRKLEVNDILYCEISRGYRSPVQKYIVVKVTPTMATVKNLENERIEIKINREASNIWSDTKGFYGKGEYKYKAWYFEDANWTEKYERQNLIYSLEYELRKEKWQKLPMDKLKELKNLIS